MPEKERWKDEAEEESQPAENRTKTNGTHKGLPFLSPAGSSLLEPQPLNKDETDSSSDDDMEEHLEDVGIVRAPDGGYGWVVVIASFIANMIVDGVIFSISETIVPLWEREFNGTTSAATVATSLLAGCYLLSGPLGSSLANSFGCNWVAVGGAVIAASGFLLTVIAPALPVVYITFGVVGGIGYGLIFLPAVVIVSQYFSEKRALATGIAVCGSGIGTSLFSYLNPLILRWSGGSWRVFIVVLACINLSCVFVSYFFKPLRPSIKQIEEATKIATEYIDRHASDAAEQRRTGTHLSVGGTAATAIETTTSPHVAQGVAIERFERDDVGRAKPAATIGATPSATAICGGGASGRSTRRNRRQLNADRPFLSTIELHASRKFENTTSRADLAAAVTKASMADLNRPLSKLDVFYTASVASLHKHSAATASGLRKRATTAAAAAPDGLTASAGSRSVLYLSTAGLPSAYNDEDEDEGAVGWRSAPRWMRGILFSMRTILDVSLLKSPSFLMLAIGGFFSMTCFFVPFMFVGALAKQNGMDESLAKYLVTILGFVNLAARVICGLVSDHPRVDPLMVSNVALVAGGVATSLAPWCYSFPTFAVYCVPFAFGVACFAALRSVICVELLGIERLTNAYGMLMLFMGVAALIGPPFAALLKNLTNSFYMSFYVMGAVMTLSGVIGFPLRAVARWEAQRDALVAALRVDPMEEAVANSEELRPLNGSGPGPKAMMITEVDE